MREPIAKPFNVPVDEEAYPHYRSIIPEPMDLSLVRDKVSAGVYQTAYGSTTGGGQLSGPVGAFARDVRLVFNNCRAFNSEESAIARHAEQLLGIFDALLSEMQKPK